MVILKNIKLIIITGVLFFLLIPVKAQFEGFNKHLSISEIIEDTLSYNESVSFRYMEGGDSVFHSKEERYYDDRDRLVFINFFYREIDQPHSWDSLYYKNERDKPVKIVSSNKGLFNEGYYYITDITYTDEGKKKEEKTREIMKDGEELVHSLKTYQYYGDTLKVVHRIGQVCYCSEDDTTTVYMATRKKGAETHKVVYESKYDYQRGDHERKMVYNSKEQLIRQEVNFHLGSTKHTFHYNDDGSIDEIHSDRRLQKEFWDIEQKFSYHPDGFTVQSIDITNPNDIEYYEKVYVRNYDGHIKVVKTLKLKEEEKEDMDPPYIEKEVVIYKR